MRRTRQFEKFRLGAIAVLAVAFCFSFLPPAQTFAQEASFPQADLREASEEVLVLFKGAAVPERLRFDSVEDAKGAIKALAKDPRIQAVAPNSLVKIGAERINPNDEHFSFQWYLEKIRAPEAWRTTQGSRSVVVGVLDTGVDLDHPDLRNNIWTNPREILDGLDNDANGYPDDVHGWDFVDDVGDPQPHFENGWTDAGVNHGTVLSGIIGGIGNNRVGIAGTSWNVRILPIRVLDSQGIGNVETVAKGIDYALRNGAQILNLSFVGFERNAVLEAAMNRATAAGLTVVAAAGNDNASQGGRNLDINPTYPVCFDGGPGRNAVIGVTATDEQDRKPAFAAYGGRCVDISAPGVSIYSTRFHDVRRAGFADEYGGFWQGSSLSTAIVSGAAALLKSIDITMTSEEIRAVLAETADPLDALNATFAGKLGAGRLNLARAVQSVAGTQPTTPVVSRALLAVGSGAGVPAEVRLFTKDGSYVRAFPAFAPPFRGGVNGASGDVDGDSRDDIVVAPASAGGPHVRIFDTSGTLKKEFFAFDTKMVSGVTLALGDLDGDGRAEIVTGTGAGGGAEVRVFDGQGNLLTKFFAYDPAFRGGVSIAVGDIDADGKKEIVTGPLTKGGPHIRVFDGKGNLKGQFFAGEKSDLRGARVAVGDTQLQGSAGIAVLPGTGPAESVRLFNGLGALYGVVDFETTVENFPFGLGDIEGKGRSALLVSVPTQEGMSFSVYNTDGRELAYVVTYPKGTLNPPNPFIVSRP